MVVTSSIINAIKYKQAFDDYLKKIHSPYKAIIAFSGKKEFKGDEYTEAGMNGFDSGKIPEKFKKSDYRFLIVAEKFQTGFDEPLLHSMYVDKPLNGVQAVQTLSRLNRAYKPYKTDTFVLDFVNTAEDIKEAFNPYYECTLLSEDTDPNKLNDLEEVLADFQIYEEQDVQNFTANYFAGENREELEKSIDSHVVLFDELEEDEQVDFKVKASSFVKTYAFLALVMEFSKKYWEELYWFLKFLIPKLKLETNDSSIEGLLDSVDLDSYTQHRQVLNQNIILDEGATEIDPITPQMRGSKTEPEKEFLHEIIAEFNKKWGDTEFGKNDLVTKMLFEDLTSEIAVDEEYIRATRLADVQNSKIAFDKMMEDKIQDLVFDYTDLYKEFEGNKDFKNDILGMMFKIVMDKQGNV
jgi:type I restriction enzyme R subunit